MADAIPAWRIQQFTSTVEHKLQQKGGKLRAHVNYRGDYTGKQVSPINFLAPTEAMEVNERYGDTPNVEMNHERRWLAPRTWEWGKLVESRDALFTGIEPTGEYTEAGVEAMRRAEDKAVLQSIWATALTGETADTSEAWNDTGYIVAASVVGPGETGTKMNLGKLINARKLFQKYHVDLEAETPKLVITEDEEETLLGINELKSSDFVSKRTVENGMLPQVYGFDIIKFSSSFLDSIPGFKAGNVRSLPVWVPSGVHLGSWKERNVRVMERPDKKGRPHIFMEQVHNATRLQLGKVLKINVDYT